MTIATGRWMIVIDYFLGGNPPGRFPWAFEQLVLLNIRGIQMYDLVIRNGTVVDGTGLPKYRADVGLSGDRIAAIGRIAERGKEEIDATGKVVTPGFIDGHTHMDAQVFWDPLGSCSCWHGVTTVVMGNCGFTLAPGSVDQRDMIISNIARAEDISSDAMDAAIRWNWTSFREYMDAVDKEPKAINYAANIGHSALRTHGWVRALSNSRRPRMTWV